MAKFSSYHTLCPGVDPQALLGVERDDESGCAVVTLGKNMAYRYKLQDLKEVGCWSSQEWLTTPVVYDKKSDRYVAVFNEKYVRIWEKGEKHLHKVKKYKFDTPFRALVSLEADSPVLVRRDGATASLTWALENRKQWTSTGIPGSSTEEWTDCRILRLNNQTHFCALVTRKAEGNLRQAAIEHFSYLMFEVDSENFIKSQEVVTRIELRRPSEELMGHVVVQDQNNAYLLTLWSHGRLYSYPLTGSCPEPVPGILVSVVTSISPKHPVAMTALNDSTIAIYGADANEEGAVLVIYNTQFKLVQALHKLKLYTKGARLWQMDNKLLLAANQHLAVVPYRLASQRIETMLGSLLRFGKNDSSNDDCDIVEIRESTVANWGAAEAPQVPLPNAPKCIAKQFNNFVNEGASDAAIQQALIPQLIESKDVRTILWCLDHLKDLPEKLLIDLLSFALRTPDTTFIPIQNGSGSHSPSLITRQNFLDRIFNLSFSDICLLPYLKAVLSFDEVLRLVEYFISKLEDGEVKKEEETVGISDKQLYEWCNLLLDSHYQNYLLSRDPKVVEMLEKLKETLNDHFQTLKEIEDLRPMLQRVSVRKPLKVSSKGFHKFYSIETIQLY